MNEEIINHRAASKKVKASAAWKAKYVSLLEAVIAGHGDETWPVPKEVQAGKLNQPVQFGKKPVVGVQFEDEKGKKTVKPVILDGGVQGEPEGVKDAEPYQGHRQGKITALAKKYTGSKSEDFQSWSRTARIWRGKYPQSSDSEMGAHLMESITDAAETQVYAMIDEGREGFTAIMQALTLAFGRGAMPEATKAIDAFERFKRGKKSVRDYLVEFQLLLSRACKSGYTLCKTSGGNTLLRNAELSAANQAAILSQVKEAQRAMGGHIEALPPFTLVWEKLDTLAQAYEATDEAKQGEKQVYFMDGGKSSKKGKKGDKKGKGAKGAGKGAKGKGAKQQWDSKGSYQGKGAKGAKGAGKGAKGKGAGKGTDEKPKCWQYEKEGWCWYGDQCKFEHGQKGKKRAAGSPSGEGAKAPRNED